MDLAHGSGRLQKEMQRRVGDAGRVVHAEMYEEAKGGGWAVVFDTEYAALKAYYAYRSSPGVGFGKSPTYSGWYVSTISSYARNASAPTGAEIDEMLSQYVETALWSSHDESDESGGNPLDQNYSVDDISDKALASMRKDVAAFATEYADDIDGEWEQAGHDFWLTRNGHGAGFWDGDWPEEAAERLTEGSKAYGESDLYVGDDGKLYVS
jgi:hypothetical protein